MSIPNCQHIVADLAERYPAEWRAAHTGGPHTEAFIRRLAWVLHSTVDARFGLNGKRGDYHTLSQDVVNWIGDGPGHDPATGKPVTVIDVIQGAGGPDPRPVWNPFSDLPGPGGWVRPVAVDGESSGDGGHPPSTSPSPVPAPDLSAILAKLDALSAEVALMRAVIDAQGAVMAQAAHESLNAAVRASEIKTQFATLFAIRLPTYTGRFWGQSITLTPKE